MEIYRFDTMDHFQKLANENNLVFFFPKLSRKHATLYFDNDFYISDHSTNGTSITYLEGRKVVLEKNRKYIYAAELLRLVSLMSLPGPWPLPILPCTAPGPGYSNLSPGRERIIM